VGAQSPGAARVAGAGGASRQCAATARAGAIYPAPKAQAMNVLPGVFVIGLVLCEAIMEAD
jgi:hypothetical protein